MGIVTLLGLWLVYVVGFFLFAVVAYWTQLGLYKLLGWVLHGWDWLSHGFGRLTK